MKQKEFFIISLTIFLTVVAWMIADIYHAAKMKRIKTTTPEINKTINVNLNREIFQILQEKQ